ncbi:MAG: type II restriction endonuclease [Rhodobacter sp.]|nr:type II restriction endonuclease [Rhodobacter sp.]
MNRGSLRTLFQGVGVKRLSAVDANPAISNQHEVGTTDAMRRQFLGADQKQQFPVHYVWLGEGSPGVISAVGIATHYDTRAEQTHRGPEWRLYYPSNAVTEAMREGDTLFLARARDGNRLWFIVAQAGSTGDRQLAWLFGLHPQGRSFVSRAIDDDMELGFAARYVLGELGFTAGDSDTDRLEALIEPFGGCFPTTAAMADLARRSAPMPVPPREDPDAALLAWLEHEEALFRRLERRNVAERLEAGFLTADGGADVDGFISFSLSVQNRRKSRMGHSLEHHVATILDAWNLEYEREALTENGHRPDFLFPSSQAYRMAVSGAPVLTMLGAKSTCKDRWRQVLAEAVKIPQKHLLTLEPGITETQTLQMQEANLQLVVPQAIHDSYTDAQRPWLWSLADFMATVAQRQETGIYG